jgi:hypothetical protein
MSEQTPPTGDPGRAPTEEELREYAERLKQITVEDIIAETIGPLINVATLRAGLVPGSEDQVDLGQLRKAIEASRALIPLVEDDIGPQMPAVRSAVSNLQMAYARLAGQGAAPAEAREGAGPEPAAPEGGEQAPPPPPEEPAVKPGEPGPAQRSGRLWVPGQ